MYIHYFIYYFDIRVVSDKKCNFSSLTLGEDQDIINFKLI